MSAPSTARSPADDPTDRDPDATVGGSPAPVKESKGPGPTPPAPTKAQRAYLARGLDQPGGKLPLFDHNGRRVSSRTVKTCLANGWAESWFSNPLKPDWQVCKLTDEGRKVVGGS